MEFERKDFRELVLVTFEECGGEKASWWSVRIVVGSAKFPRDKMRQLQEILARV
jgi:hypothetical protein